MMRAINQYRRACGNPPIAPWAKERLCTTHVKHRVLDHYLRSLSVAAHDRWVGLRADEPHRVAGLRRQETATRTLTAPLYQAGVTKEDVAAFRADQPFDLGIPEHDGNCDGCFLKDQADIARAIGTTPEATAFWQGMQDDHPRFGGERLPSYAMLAGELPVRLDIERALRDGKEPPAPPPGVDPRRLVVIQERKRYAAGPQTFSCACEGAMDPEHDGRVAERDRLCGPKPRGTLGVYGA